MGGAFDSSAEALRLQDTQSALGFSITVVAVGEDEIASHFS